MGENPDLAILSFAFPAIFSASKFFMLYYKDKKPSASPTEGANISNNPFGKTTDGKVVEKFTLKNNQGMEADIITYGGIITSLRVPDREGHSANVVLGFDHLEQYLRKHPYFGAIVGRFANRIAGGRFSIDDQEYKLAVNNGPNHLHGGLKGFDKAVWAASEEKIQDGVALKLTHVSPDGEEGFPGTLTTTVIYSLTNDNALEVNYGATTDRKTILNFTHHAYFNLSGDFSKDILDHELSIAADAYLPVNKNLIPTGEFRAVEGTPFDFRQTKPIGQDIGKENDQLAKGSGYDHCWALNRAGSYRKISIVHHPASGRIMEVYSDQPGVQLYTGNHLDGTLPNPSGGTYGPRSGFCLETQHYPDSPNQPHFPSVELAAGEKFTSKTSFKFSTK